MKTMFIGLLALAVPLAAQDMSCPMHQQHASAGAHHSEVEEHGDQAMGFSHLKTTHHFLLYSNGGAIEVTANDGADAVSVREIREHLTHIAKMFSEGDFSAPMFVHSQVPPGVPVMEKKQSAITYAYEELAAGGKVQIKSNDPEAVSAIHEFMRFQIEDHHTGDSTEVSSSATPLSSGR